MTYGHKLAALALVLVLLLCSIGCVGHDVLPTGTTGKATEPTSLEPSAPPQTTVPEQSTVTPTQPQTTAPSAESTAPATDPSTEATTEPTTEPTVPSTQAPTEEATEAPTQAPTQPPVTAPPATTEPAPTDPPAPPAIIHKVTVEASGVLTKQNDKAIIDYSNTKDGYVMVQYTQPVSKRLKVLIKGPTTTYQYNLPAEQWVAFPLSDGNGKYQISVCINASGTKYAVELSLTIDPVTMTDEFAPFLHSNQYVDFDAAPNAAAKAAQLTAGISDPLKKVEKIYDFVVGSLTYDKELAATVKTGYLPVLDDVLARRKGICFDYAALMTGMLRSQDVPTKLVVGYAGEVYHAWISVWSESDGWVDGVIWFDGSSWKRMDPTFASSGGSGSDILNYIGNGANYTAKYFY